MKRRITGALLWALAATAAAHEGHGPLDSGLGRPIDAVQARDMAQRVVASFLQRGRLGGGWNQAQCEEGVRKPVEGAVQWEARCHNPDEQRPERRTLYIRMNEQGKPLRAGFSAQ